VRFYKLAADNDVADAQYTLGTYFEEGRGGVVKSQPDAIRVFKLAAANGDERAQAKLVVSRSTEKKASSTASATK
jgi:uncharacterized protein